tara:strand:- start:47 stop:364 length:318 start_codon:yes stop_codon:yes gene_type:complete
MSLPQRAKGLSLKVGPLGENDRLLTILTEDNGICRLAIPGARKLKSRLGATSPFNFLDLPYCREKRSKASYTNKNSQKLWESWEASRNPLSSTSNFRANPDYGWH